MSTTIEKRRRDWRFGRCYAMAIALHRLLHRPIHVLSVEIPTCTRHSPWRSHVVHAWISGEDEEHGLDAGGSFDLAGLDDTFLRDTLRAFRDPVRMTFDTENEFVAYLAACAGKGWWEEMERVDLRPDIPKAIDFAELHVLPTQASARLPGP